MDTEIRYIFKENPRVSVLISFVILQNKVEETASAEVGAGGGGMDVDQEDVEMPDAPPVLVHQVKEKICF